MSKGFAAEDLEWGGSLGSPAGGGLAGHSIELGLVVASKLAWPRLPMTFWLGHASGC